MKLPGPDHPITIERNPKRVRVIFNGHVVAESSDALTLKEATLAPVFYIPREDADMSELRAHYAFDPLSVQGRCCVLQFAGRRACVGQCGMDLRSSPFPRWRRSPGGWRSTAIASMRSKNRDRCGSCAALRAASAWLRSLERGSSAEPIRLGSRCENQSAPGVRGAARMGALGAGRLWLRLGQPAPGKSSSMSWFASKARSRKVSEGFVTGSGPKFGEGWVLRTCCAQCRGGPGTVATGIGRHLRDLKLALRRTANAETQRTQRKPCPYLVDGSVTHS